MALPALLSIFMGKSLDLDPVELLGKLFGGDDAPGKSDKGFLSLLFEDADEEADSPDAEEPDIFDSLFGDEDADPDADANDGPSFFDFIPG